MGGREDVLLCIEEGWVHSLVVGAELDAIFVEHNV
jgi:hypothetical protein